MTNSSLATVTAISPNKNVMTNKKLRRLTPHCFVGQVTAKRGLEVFMPKSRQASCNYVIGKDGDIGLCVEEKDRSWCSSSRENDEQAITFEIASDTKSPYAITDKALNSLINLMVDICKRNGKTHITWISNKTKALAYTPANDELLITVHRWFKNKACPGDYIMGKLPYIVEQVNAKLKPSTSVLYRVQVGAFSVKSNADKLDSELKAKGYSTIIKHDTLYRVQVGAFSVKTNAENMAKELQSKGYSTIIKN